MLRTFNPTHEKKVTAPSTPRFAQVPTNDERSSRFLGKYRFRRCEHSFQSFSTIFSHHLKPLVFLDIVSEVPGFFHVFIFERDGPTGDLTGCDSENDERCHRQQD
jgi:hypothetical protein